jgi:AraC family transcriptional regulator
MHVEQITGVVGGQIVSATNAPLLTSASTPWSGFLLEIHDAGIRQDIIRWGWHRTHVSLFTDGRLSFRVRNPSGDQNFVARAGSTCVFPYGFSETDFSIASSNFQVICIELDPDLANALIGSKASTAACAPAPQIVTKDAHITALLKTMALEVSQGSPTGALYGQSLSLALMSYLAATSSVEREKKPSHRFSHAQAQRIIDYIRSNLDCELSLFDLAGVVRLRPRQFVRVFKETFGRTPHQYLIYQRVTRAKELLLGEQPLVDIASAVGFAHQSHFSTMFQKITGISPGRFRRSQQLQTPKRGLDALCTHDDLLLVG